MAARREVPTVVTSQGGETVIQPRAAAAAATKKQRFAGADLDDREAFAKKLNALWDALEETANAAVVLPFARGTLIRDVEFTSGTAKTLNHLLGRKYDGAFAIGSRTNAIQIKYTRATDALDARQITVTPDATGTADVVIW